MTPRPGDGPEDVEAAFAQIVADLRREGVGLPLPTEAEVTRDRADTADDQPPAQPKPPAPSPQPKPPASTWRAHDTEIDWNNDNEDEHYEPPEPPPLPRLRPITITALLTITAGIALLVLSSTVLSTIWTPVGIALLAVGIGTLLLTTRRHPRPDDDNGAQV
ncbi:hypothetical protein [Actinokineospora bangkokensis]|uniref:DUF308 domain-containing protein n=1 Tax=Actinokineospora bangkokensis TaxID=1193682 RepID=A0A1Q9LSZ5_9PSEU|nr:hypothetical protein [Actinokineospora bangkokensis]OLR95162.1 hypothetical protein BJP25_07635 [Actinokineospora bangkokensis]